MKTNKLIHRFKIQDLDQLEYKIVPFNHLLNFVTFFDIYEEKFYDDKNKLVHYYNCSIVFNMKALKFLY